MDAKDNVYTNVYDKNGTELKVGDIVRRGAGNEVYVEMQGLKIPGEFTYRPVGSFLEKHSYPLSDLVKDDIEIVGFLDLNKYKRDSYQDKENDDFENEIL